jgi:hypothetical protein
MHKIVREQLQLLLDVGHSHRTIGQAAGCSRSVVGNLIYHSKTINPQVFTAIMNLEIKPPWDTPGVTLTGRTQVPATGTIRRLRALARMGYPLPRIAEAVRITEVYLRVLINADPSSTVRAATEQAVADFYRSALTNIPAWRYSERTRKWAESKGWLGAGAWDDIDRDEGPIMEGDLGVLVDFVKEWPGLTTTDLQQKIRSELGMQGTTAGRLIKEALDLGEIERVRNRRSVRVYAAA